MSTLIPDLNPKSNIEKYYITQATETYVETPKTIDSIDSEEFKRQLDLFVNSFSEEHRLLYKYAKASARLTKNHKNSSHFLKLFSEYFFNSLNKTFPNMDWTELKKAMDAIQISLDKSIKHVNLENDFYIPALLGMTAGLIEHNDR